VYFHGEELLVWMFVILGVVALALVVFSVWLVKVCKRSLGNRAYWIAPVPCVVVLVVGFLFSRGHSPRNGPPTALPTTQLRALMRALPAYAAFSYSGLEFYKGKLYVCTNLGVLEVENGRVAKVYRVQDKYSVVSGPWLDTANNLLWLMDDQTNEMLNFDGSTWHRVKMPEPKKGYYSRGDILGGVRPAVNPNGFWMAAGGSVWRWDSSRKSWNAEPQPGSTDSQDTGDVIGVLPVAGKTLLIMRHEPLSFLVKQNQDFKSDTVVVDDGGWRAIRNDGKASFLAEKWVVAGDSGYICTTTGALLQVTTQGITRLDTPGDCEAIATVASGSLLASFRRGGIYEYDGHWLRRTSNPYPSGEGEYSAHLSGDEAQLAYAVEAMPVVDEQHSSETDMKFTRNAPTSLWSFEGNEWRPVDLP
jgi:hypothetical protein